MLVALVEEAQLFFSDRGIRRLMALSMRIPTYELIDYGFSNPKLI